MASKIEFHRKFDYNKACYCVKKKHCISSLFFLSSLFHIFEKCNLCEPSVQFLSFFVFIIIFVLKWVIPMSLIYSSLGNFIIFICLNFISFHFFFKVNTKATKSFLLRNSFFLKFHHYMIILAYYRKAQFLWRPYVVFVSFFF